MSGVGHVEVQNISRLYVVVSSGVLFCSCKQSQHRDPSGGFSFEIDCESQKSGSDCHADGRHSTQPFKQNYRLSSSELSKGDLAETTLRPDEFSRSVTDEFSRYNITLASFNGRANS